MEATRSAVSSIPGDVLELKEQRDAAINRWGLDTGFQYTPDFSQHPVGYAVFRNRIKSHQDVAARVVSRNS